MAMNDRQKIIREISPYMGLASGMIATLVLFGGIGWFIDDSNNSYPLWTAVLSGIGAIVAIINFIRNVLRFSRADEERKIRELEKKKTLQHRGSDAD